MKRQKRVCISIDLYETDRLEVRLVEGRVGAGELIHWPLSLGWLSCCHSVPWWAFYLPSFSLSSSSVPTQVIPPLPPLSSSSGGAEHFDSHTMPKQRFHKQEALKKRKPLRSLLRNHSFCRCMPPVHALPTLSMPTCLPVPEKKTKNHTHWWTTMAASIRPLMVANRVPNFWAWSAFLFFLFYYCCMLILCLFIGSHWERSDLRTIQSMAAYGVILRTPGGPSQK